jgi:hypothetical protein
MPNSPDTLPALSIRQPWAHAILDLGKDIENRGRPARYRGPLLLHAGVALSAAELSDCIAWMKENVGDACKRVPTYFELQRGGIIASPADGAAGSRQAGRRLRDPGRRHGMAELVDCVEDSDSPWFEGPFGWVLANPRPLPFVPYRGQLGLFRVPRNILQI